MLTLQRRHSLKCPDRKRGPNHLRCRGSCPLWATGTLEGKRTRISLQLRDLNRAARRLTELEDQKFGRPRKSIAAAIAAFHAQGAGLAAETKRKYKRILRRFGEFCENSSLV